MDQSNYDELMSVNGYDNTHDYENSNIFYKIYNFFHSYSEYRVDCYIV